MNTRARPKLPIRRATVDAMRKGLLVAGMAASLSCSDPPSEPQYAATSTAVTAAPLSPEARAELDRGNRETVRKEIDGLKKQLADTNGADNAAVSALLEKLKNSRQKYESTLPGAIGPIPGAKGAAAPPYNANKYANLLSKMSAYDMKKPEDVAAWLRYKHQELDQ